MKDQVTTIEQSRRLLELGVPAEKASMCWVRDPYKAEYNLAIHDESCYEMACLEPVPAYTVADLLEMLPEYITDADDQKHDYCLTLYHCFCWNLGYENRGAHRSIGDRVDFDLIALLCNRIEWLVSNEYKMES